jgi:hypothetical protein
MAQTQDFMRRPQVKTLGALVVVVGAADFQNLDLVVRYHVLVLLVVLVVVDHNVMVLAVAV